MPDNANRQFLDFEKPIKDLVDEIERLKHAQEHKKIDYSDQITKLDSQISDRRKEITEHLSNWQRVQLSRHPDRPYTLKYIQKMTTNFVELFGDRNVKDDKAMIGGFAMLDGQTVMIIGQQKGINTKTRQLRNFGMANPEGYRKALRLMKLAEKFNKPVITLIDTPGAYPGLEAEERGQGEAIARNIYEMIRLRVPVICVIIGEGASGGALGIGVGDRVYMMENTWYTVISPESCSSILWRSWENKEIAAEQLRLTANEMLGFGLIDGILPEPDGGAHWDYDMSASIVKSHVIRVLNELKRLSPEERINQRIEKFGKMGFWEEEEEQVDSPESLVDSGAAADVSVEASAKEAASAEASAEAENSGEQTQPRGLDENLSSSRGENSNPQKHVLGNGEKRREEEDHESAVDSGQSDREEKNL